MKPFKNKALIFIVTATTVIIGFGVSISPQQIIESIINLSQSKTVEAFHVPGHVGEQNPGSLSIDPITSPVTTATLSVTGTGLGGEWRRGRNCLPDGYAYGYFTQRLVNSVPQTPGDTPTFHNPPTPSTYHPNPLISRNPRYSIDGQDRGTYVLNETSTGGSAPPDCSNPGGTEHSTFPEYDFQIDVDVSGLSNGTHTITVDAYDESTENIITASANFEVQHDYRLNCTIIQSVLPDQPASYTLSISGSGLSGTFLVTMASPPPPGPPSPVMSNSLSLNAGNGYTGVANVTTTGLTPGATYNLIFTASNGGTSLTCPAQLIINRLDPPRVDIKFNGSDVLVALGSGVDYGTISWENQNVDTCTATTIPGTVVPPWSGSAVVTPLLSGSLFVSRIVPETLYTFSLSCTGLGETELDSVQVIATALPPPSPTVDIKCLDIKGQPIDGPCDVDYGASGVMTWTSEFANACSIDNGIGIVDVNNPAPGIPTNNVTEKISYVITCTGPGSPDAVDTVTFQPLPEQATFSLACTPASITLAQGDTGSYNLETTRIADFNSPVTFSTFDILPVPGNPADISFVNNDQVPSAITTAVVATNTSTSLGTYTLTFDGTGGGISRQCNVELIVTAIANPEPPINVVVTNTICDTIDIIWDNPGTIPYPDSFRLYHRISSKSPWQQIGADIPFIKEGNYLVTHTIKDNPPLNLSISNYYAVSAVYGTTESARTVSNPISIIPTSCAPNITRSDKDVTKVEGKINKTFSPIVCSGESEIASFKPSNAVFSVGDKVTFQINVCNSGPGSFTGVSILDTLSNLSQPESFSSPQDCLVKTAYEELTNTISFFLGDIGPGDVTTQSCSVVFTATVTAPAVTTAALYRFQNIGDISTNELPVYRVLTPPYLFSIAGGVPDRIETAPN